MLSASMWLMIRESPPVALGSMPKPGMAGEGRMISEACWTALKQHQWGRRVETYCQNTVLWGIQREMSSVGESG
jgi:hypothetical protein